MIPHYPEAEAGETPACPGRKRSGREPDQNGKKSGTIQTITASRITVSGVPTFR